MGSQLLSQIAQTSTAWLPPATPRRTAHPHGSGSCSCRLSSLWSAEPAHIGAAFDGDYLWLTLGPRKGLDPEAGVRAAHRLREIPGVKVGGDYGSVKWASATAEQIAAALEVARHMVRELSSASE
jgi:hypothetical protein